MINTEAGKVLVHYSKHIARWAKQGDKSEDKETAVSRRAHENAWRLLSALITFAEHAKESDLYWTLAELAPERGKTAAEQRRLYAVAKLEDRAYVKAKAELEKLLADMLREEEADPKALESTMKPGARPASKTVLRGPSAKSKVLASASTSAPKAKAAKAKKS